MGQSQALGVNAERHYEGHGVAQNRSRRENLGMSNLSCVAAKLNGRIELREEVWSDKHCHLENCLRLVNELAF